MNMSICLSLIIVVFQDNFNKNGCENINFILKDLTKDVKQSNLYIDDIDNFIVSVR